MSELRMLVPTDIIVGDRFRSDNELDDEFLDSIRDKGIIQPITVTRTLELIAGGRRLAAATKLGISEIPALIRETEGELDLRECELIENAFRKDLGWVDRNALINRIHSLMEEKHGTAWNQRRTAEVLNKSVGGINRHLALNKALQTFPKLAQCKTEDEAVKLFRKLGESVVRKDLVRQQEARVASTREDGNNKANIPLGVRLANHASSHYRLGDAFDGLQEILDNNLSPNIALVEIDPPYGIDLQAVKKGDGNGLGEYNEIDAPKYPDFLFKTLDICYKITPKNCRFIIWFGIEWYDVLLQHLKKIGFDYDFIPGIWHKPTGQTAAPDLYLARSYETFLVAWKGNPPPIPKRGRSNIFSFNPEPASRKYHPTQRPTELMEEILLTFSWPGAVVLSPFLGSGATIRAAYRCGMNAFGWDLSAVYREAFLAAVEKDVQKGLLNEVRTLE